MTGPTPSRAVAIHESGHALMACALGLDMVEATVQPTGDALGAVTASCSPRAREGDPPSDLDQGKALVCLALYIEAGAAAERLGGFTPSGCEDDEAGARHIGDRVHDLAGVEGPYWRPEARAAAARFLRLHWTKVEAVAAALLVSRTLDGEQVRELVGDLPAPDVRALFGSLAFWTARAAARARTREAEVPA